VEPVDAPAHYARVTTWEEGSYGLDLSPVRPFALNNVLAQRLDSGALLGPPRSICGAVTLEARSADLGGEVLLTIERAGTVHGLGGWFQAELAPGVELTNAPPDHAPSWSHAFLPVEHPLDVKPGDELRARLNAARGDHVLSWDVSHPADGSSRRGLRQSTFFGFPLSAARRARTPTSTPTLNRWGEITRWALSQIDGATQIGELERELLSRFPGAFASEEDVAGYLSDLLAEMTE
jgi:hypothetical protein